LPSDALDRLLAIGRPDGPDASEALRLFARLRTTPEEGRAIESLLGLGALALPEELLVAVGSALVDRGEHATAARVLARAASSPALVLRADLLAHGGDLAPAVALVERVLLRDIDWPGARERHTRWRDALGLTGAPPHPDSSSATMMTSQPEAPFRLVREVGRGGAGAVYESEDRDLGRRVALKVYHRPDRDRAQLLHEARVAVALGGSGVVRVFDVHPDHGWLVMEWAPLGALRLLLRAHDAATLVPMERWAVPLADALSRAHAAGWVHHDVKPANVLLCAPDMPLLTDFGIARRVGEPSPPGSLGYVSPERIAGRASHPRDDVYGYGRVLEDVIEALGEPADPSGRWGVLATACVGPDDTRPEDGSVLADFAREASYTTT
jgi:hypothetical protein